MHRRPNAHFGSLKELKRRCSGMRRRRSLLDLRSTSPCETNPTNTFLNSKKFREQVFVSFSELKPLNSNSVRSAQLVLLSRFRVRFSNEKPLFSQFNLLPELFRAQKSVSRVCSARTSAAEVQEAPRTPTSRPSPFRALRGPHNVHYRSCVYEVTEMPS